MYYKLFTKQLYPNCLIKQKIGEDLTPEKHLWRGCFTSEVKVLPIYFSGGFKLEIILFLENLHTFFLFFLFFKFFLKLLAKQRFRRFFVSNVQKDYPVLKFSNFLQWGKLRLGVYLETSFQAPNFKLKSDLVLNIGYRLLLKHSLIK